MRLVKNGFTFGLQLSAPGLLLEEGGHGDLIGELEKTGGVVLFETHRSLNLNLNVN